MKDGTEFRIRLVSGPSKTWLSLHGSVLTYREQSWVGMRVVDIPVELIRFTERRRFKGSRLIAALLALLVFPLLGGVVIGLWYLVAGPPSAEVKGLCMGVGVMIGLIVFLVLLVRFLIRQKTASIHIASDGVISFWVEPRRNAEWEALKAEIQRRQALVEETVAYPLQFALGDALPRPWRRTVVLTLMCLGPAFITEIPWLLLLGLIPIGWQLYASFRSLGEPPAMRQALRHFWKREWEPALKWVRELAQTHPEYRPARLLMIELQMRQGDFDGAAATLAELHHELDPETVQAIQRNLVLRRRLAVRKQQSPPPPADAPGGDAAPAPA